MEFGTVSAQSMMEEQLREVVVTGSLYADCDMCRGSFLRADLAYHKQYDCPARTVVCDICHVSYKAYEGHFCNGNGYSGSGPSSGPSNGNSSTVGNSGNTSSGNSSSGAIGQFLNTRDPSNPLYDASKNISVKEIKKDPTIKLVPNLRLPDKLHEQKKRMECVPRAFAFMAEMKGYDYETVFNALCETAMEEGVDIREDGLLPKEVLAFFNDYCQIEADFNTASNVASYVNQGIPVAVITCTGGPHMVTIIGYDRYNYYTAAGNGMGYATVYPKTEFNCHEFIYIFNKTKTPYK